MTAGIADGEDEPTLGGRRPERLGLRGTDAEPDDPVVGDELEDARWFAPDEVRAALAGDWREPEAGEGIVLSAPVSIARWLAERWLAEVTESARDRG